MLVACPRRGPGCLGVLAIRGVPYEPGELAGAGRGQHGQGDQDLVGGCKAFVAVALEQAEDDSLELRLDIGPERTRGSEGGIEQLDDEVRNAIATEWQCAGGELVALLC